MLVVFGVFVALGGFAGGHLLHLGGPRTCLVGFCGVAVALVAAVVFEAVVAVVGPGVAELVFHAVTRPRGRS
jgi:predicted MFS family arabinose efflux permease